MTDTQTLQFEGLSVTVVRSKRKTLTLEISAEGLKARAPLRMRESSIKQFVLYKRAWIEKHLDSRPAPSPAIALRDGAVMLFQGQPHRLQVMLGKRGKGQIEATTIVLPVSRSHLSAEQSTKTKLIKFYKSSALTTIRQRISVYASQMAVPDSKRSGVRVRDYKRRWGSCDHLGRLSFNWRIIQAPPEVLDYVVVHELAHCHEFNHSKRFWSIVERQMPDWRDRQAWLQNHGAQLYRF